MFNHYLIEAAADPDAKVSLFTKSLEKINWGLMLNKVIHTLCLLIIISIIFIIFNVVGKKIIKHSFETTQRTKKLSAGRVKTIYSLTNNAYHYTILFFYLYGVLSLFGVPVGTLVAGAGILSVAIGLGAQGFVTDMVTGLFILIEQQFTVGETVKIGTIQGTVSGMGLRTTQITSSDGTVNFIPNRNITIVSNFSRNNMQVNVDIHLQPEQDIAKVNTIIAQVNEKIVPTITDLTQTPNVLGLVDAGKGNLVYRITLTTKPGGQGAAQRAFLHAYYRALQENGIMVAPAVLNITL